MKKLVSICMLVVLCLPLAAQKEKLTLKLHDVLFSELVDSLEEKIWCKVFYADDWVDSFYVSVDAVHEEVAQIMAHALAGSGFSFIITGNNQVILSEGHTIKTNFREEYEKYLADRMSKMDTAIYSLSRQAEEEGNGISEEFRLYKIGNPAEMEKIGKVALTGTILYTGSDVPVMGAIVYIRKLQIGASTDAKGNYTLLLPRGQHTVEFRRVGMKSTIRNLIVYSGGTYNLEMEEKINQLEEVTVSAEQENQVLNMRMGTEKINIKMLKQIPLGLGEVDVIKSSLLLPGVQSVGEAAAGYNVRGGST
ncbi:MAG: carboxypeptidase-like regulatory domain-containing protein, partial [Bacteroidales bacterium]|nr:carboxypeptidase-like regulatory domain-containing protein [Bacteroidales bacterium]